MKQQEWLDHFKKQEEQGISGSRYCRENSLSQSQFSYWRNKLKNKPRLSRGFVRVMQNVEQQEDKNSIFISFPKGVVIHLPNNFDPSKIASLLREL